MSKTEKAPLGLGLGLLRGRRVEPEPVPESEPGFHAVAHRRTQGAISVLLAGILFLSGCGYALVGRANFLPPDIKTIQVPAFVNRTTRVELEQRVTSAVSEEIVSRARLRLVNAPADAHVILRGVIQSFGITPVSFNEEGRATRYQAHVTAAIELVDHRNDDKVIWKNDQYIFRETYEVDPSQLDAFDQETRAIQQIAERFAESVVANLLEGF